MKDLFFAASGTGAEDALVALALAEEFAPLLASNLGFHRVISTMQMLRSRVEDAGISIFASSDRELVKAITDGDIITLKFNQIEYSVICLIHSLTNDGGAY